MTNNRDAWKDVTWNGLKHGDEVVTLIPTQGVNEDDEHVELPAGTKGRIEHVGFINDYQGHGATVVIGDDFRSRIVNVFDDLDVQKLGFVPIKAA